MEGLSLDLRRSNFVTVLEFLQGLFAKKETPVHETSAMALCRIAA